MKAPLRESLDHSTVRNQWQEGDLRPVAVKLVKGVIPHKLRNVPEHEPDNAIDESLPT
jgi:hypothetical protein